MFTTPADFNQLASLVFLLGVKHGFDADHLATIDGLTRFNAAQRPRLARYCGTLFSLGHGAVVLAIALAVGAWSSHWQVPHWFEALGNWTSIVFLSLLGAANLRAVVAASSHEIVRPAGIMGRWLRRLQSASPVLILLIGALFALSFDTLSQATLFALTATQFGGLGNTATLGLLFMFGMLTTDGINGLWISRLISRADRSARIASRVMGLAVASISLLVAVFGALKLMFPSLEAWSEGKDLLFGGLVIACMAGSFCCATRLVREPDLALRAKP